MIAVQTPCVTVLMPAYNSERYIHESISSALDQTFTDFELLVIDDCSNDSTDAIVEDIAASDERVKLVKLPENLGVAKARNYGVGMAQGQWIALLDSDDLWEPVKLQRQIELAQKDGLDLVYSSYDLIDESGVSLNRTFVAPEHTDYSHMLKDNVIGCSSVLLRSELLSSNPFSADYYHEDYLLWMTLLRSGIRVEGLTDVLMHHRQIEDARSANKFNAAKQRWDIYRRGLGLSFVDSSSAFLHYGIAGVKKHRF